MNSLLINLDRSADRLARMEEEFRRVGVAFARVPGFDGADLSPGQVDAFIRERPAYPASRWSRGQIGCFLSHTAAWKLAAAGADAVAAIFEDDVHLASDIGELLASDGWIPSDADIVRLEGMGNVKLGWGRPLPPCKGRLLHRIHSDTFGAAGYILTKRAAKTLLATPPARHIVVDDFLFMPRVSPIAAMLRRYQIAPSVCVQDQFRGEGRIGIRSLIAPGVHFPLPTPKRRNPFSILRPYTKVTVAFRP